jgi:hypothetical protein
VADKTIDDLGAYGALNGTEQVELQGAGAGPSGKTTTQDIANLGGGGGGGFPLVPTVIVTGAAPVTADPTVALYAITTGGTGGEEVIDLPLFAYTVAGSINPENMGRRIGFYLAVQTDPGDTVKITVGGSDQIYVYLPAFVGSHLGQQRTLHGAQLTFVEATVALVWANDLWLLDEALADVFDSNVYQSDTLRIKPEDNSAGGAGSNLTLDAAQGATDGLIVMGSNTALPTVAPATSGAIWRDPATNILHIVP